MKRITAIVCAACLAVCAVGCSDAAPLAVAQRTAPPKPAAPPPGDKGEDEPAIPAQFGPNNPAIAPGNPAVVPNVPGTIAPAGPATPNPAIPNALPTNPGLNPNLIPVLPGANPAPSGPIPATPGVTPATPAATPAPDKSAPAAGNPFANLLPGSAPPAGNGANGATPPANVTVTPAAPGVGDAGKGYGNGDAGFITRPIAAYFGIREQLIYDQIKHNMDTFRALNNRTPKDQAEFDKEIIQASNIHMPDLPQGSNYHYNPKSGELEVWMPK